MLSNYVVRLSHLRVSCRIKYTPLSMIIITLYNMAPTTFWSSFQPWSQNAPHPGLLFSWFAWETLPYFLHGDNCLLSWANTAAATSPRALHGSPASLPLGAQTSITGPTAARLVHLCMVTTSSMEGQIVKTVGYPGHIWSLLDFFLTF